MLTLTPATGHVADALQNTDPDVYVSSDGGYSWRLVRLTTDVLHNSTLYSFNICTSHQVLVVIPTSFLHILSLVLASISVTCWYSFRAPTLVIKLQATAQVT